MTTKLDSTPGLGALDIVQQSTAENVGVSNSHIFHPGQVVQVFRTDTKNVATLGQPEYEKIGQFTVAEINEKLKTLSADDLPADIRPGDLLLVDEFRGLARTSKPACICGGADGDGLRRDIVCPRCDSNSAFEPEEPELLKP